MSGKRYKRFYVSESENQFIVYDNEGLDDYYHLGNDERDVKGICKLLNEQQKEIDELKKEKEKLVDGMVKRYLAMPHLNPEPEL